MRTATLKRLINHFRKPGESAKACARRLQGEAQGWLANEVAGAAAAWLSRKAVR